ncbi:MAG: pilin, partial [Candidatus Pacebacteria bacterium]|nr:pilin [Candidatus Paceibacterota bacterium]
MKKLLLIFVLFFPFLIFAQTSLEMKYPGLEATPALPEYILYIFNFVFGVFGLIIFFVLILAGVSYIFSTGDPTKTKDARDRIKSAVMGFLLLTFSFLIFNTINPELVNFNTIIDSIKRTPLFFVDSPKTEEPDLIVKEIPLGKAIEYTLRKQGPIDSTIEPLGKIEKLTQGIEEFLTREIKVTPPDFFEIDGKKGEASFYRLADLNKYLKNLTEHCKASNLIAICTESESGSRPQGCQGDVCLLDQNQKDSLKVGVRPNMNQIIEINKIKIKPIKDNNDLPNNPSTINDKIEFQSLLQIPPKIR